MFNKEGIPFFVIMIPFLCVIFISFFSTSYYLKITEEKFQRDIKEQKILFAKTSANNDYNAYVNKKKVELKVVEDKFIRFILIFTILILFFMAIFTILMISIINDIIKKYIKEVEFKETKLQNLNKNLSLKVKKGIADAKKKDKTILEQSKHARMGSMISMIAHQWRQPLSELSGILMELETATRFKKVNEKHILKSIERSDEMIEFMSNTIDDFRNFYKPDKKKEYFNLYDSCRRAINLIDASLKENNITLSVQIDNDKKIFGYPTEFSQVILNLISNAKDVLEENKILEPIIDLSIKTNEEKSIIEVKDNAGGIEEEYLDLIFDPYYSTKDSSKGTGLGLYISKLIIEKNMGGELSVSNGTHGAVFKIVL